jgi:hypothetical protein
MGGVLVAGPPDLGIPFVLETGIDIGQVSE